MLVSILHSTVWRTKVLTAKCLQVGLQAAAWVSVGAQIGDEVEVKVEEAHPRDDIIYLKEVVR